MKRLAMIALAVVSTTGLAFAPAHAQSDAQPLPVKVFILAGQSNMQGKGGIEGEGANTLRHMVENDTKKEFQEYVNLDGSWRERQDVWIHYDLYPFRELRHGLLKPGFGASSGQIGPEFGFGHVMGDSARSQVLLIKAAWGGKSLGHNFLPPSVGKYPLPVEPDDPGYFYHRILQLAEEVTVSIETFFPDYKGQGVEIAGLCWHQGWNDQYGGLDADYETNLAAFIKDIRSTEYGLGVPGLPVVIAGSGMISADSPVVQGQLAMADAEKYPEFVGNVAVIDTHQPYGPDKMTFKFDNDGPTEKVGYHWNNNARSYTNIGRALAAEMLKLDQPKLPARLVAHGCDQGVQLIWQLGSETPASIDILRNGKSIGAKLSPKQTTYVDTAAEPGANSYELSLVLPSGKQTLNASCDTSPTDLTSYRSMQGVMLSWKARGKYEGFRVKRDSRVIADDIAADVRSFEDTQAPAKGNVRYTVEPTTGKATPAALAVNRGPADAGGALVYEPFDYPANVDEVQYLTGKGGVVGTMGSYVYLGDRAPERAPATVAKGLRFGDLPVTGNRGSTHRWSEGGYIELDDSLKKAGLLKDGATMWMSYVFMVRSSPQHTHRNGGGVVTLRSEDMKEGVGFKADGRQYETVVVVDGEEQPRRITGTRPDTPILVVGRIIWGKDGENDSFVPFNVGLDLRLPEKEGRHSVPFNIDQSKLSRLVLSGEGQFDEIRVGPTYASVIGAKTK